MKRGYVEKPEHWRYSSARNYIPGKKAWPRKRYDKESAEKSFGGMFQMEFEGKKKDFEKQIRQNGSNSPHHEGLTTESCKI